jgi:hypothetical protein
MSGSAASASNEAPWHRFGMGLSVLCLLHCLALPWLLASLPIAVLAALPESLRDNEWVHAALIAPVLLVSGPVLLRGQPGAVQTLLVIAAFTALIGGLFVAREAVEEALTVAGTLLLTAHWHRLRKAHPH